VIAVVAFGTLAWSILRTESVSVVAHRMPSLTVGRIGEALMTGYVWPLQCTGLLLTAALIGALVLVMEEKQ
jgi:NADH:ubiquinone oxidoreductase subunit 6 (subunit J)